jgi:CRISPR-associated protein Csx10
MRKLRLSITNRFPFSLSASRAVGNVQESLDFIPGTALRGALAGLYLQSKTPDDEFEEIFTKDKVIFPNLYINGARPVPLSAYSCKYYSGFLGDKEKHGVVDLLLPLVREDEGGVDLPEGFKNCQYRESGKACGIETKKCRGYYKKRFADSSLESITVKKRLIYHTAISPLTETAEENTLYSQEVVERGQTFKGEIFVFDDTLFEKVKKFIESQKILFLGSDRTSGYGKFEIVSIEPKDGIDGEKIEGRIKQFNELLRLNDRTHFSITLQSDAIVTDKYMRYKTFIDAEDIAIPGAELVMGIAENRIIQGWSALSRMPKDDVLAIEKGSVFVFAVDSTDDNILAQLSALERNGIGKRRGEGLGRLTVCDPFHLQEGPR